MDSVGCVAHAELVPRQARRSARGACDEVIVPARAPHGLAETCAESLFRRARSDSYSTCPATSTTTMSSPFIKARGWERFVVYDATGAFSLSPSAKNMPPCDARGRAVTAPGRSRGSLSDEEYDLAMRRVRELLDLDPETEAAKEGADEVMWAVVASFFK